MMIQAHFSLFANVIDRYRWVSQVTAASTSTRQLSNWTRGRAWTPGWPATWNCPSDSEMGSLRTRCTDPTVPWKADSACSFSGNPDGWATVPREWRPWFLGYPMVSVPGGGGKEVVPSRWYSLEHWLRCVERCPWVLGQRYTWQEIWLQRGIWNLK